MLLLLLVHRSGRKTGSTFPYDARAPSLQARYPAEELRLILMQYRGLTADIDRFSIPSWGGRRFGFFGVYTENSVLEMILEIDENERIIHWIITDDVAAKDQHCVLSGL
jgi:hypothetical protein